MTKNQTPKHTLNKSTLSSPHRRLRRELSRTERTKLALTLPEKGNVVRGIVYTRGEVKNPDLTQIRENIYLLAK
jgi:hypothetical protein